MPLPATHLQPVQAIVKMALAPDLSLRGGRRPTRQFREGTADRYRPSSKRHAPIASAAALIERPVQGHSNEEGTGAPQQGSTAVRTVCFCFHYDGSRKNVNKIFKNSSAERVEKFVRKPAANFIGRNKSPEFYVTFRIVTRCAGVNKITQPEMR